jgi:hypothetical protein
MFAKDRLSAEPNYAHVKEGDLLAQAYVVSAKRQGGILGYPDRGARSDLSEIVLARVREEGDGGGTPRFFAPPLPGATRFSPYQVLRLV